MTFYVPVVVVSAVLELEPVAGPVLITIDDVGCRVIDDAGDHFGSYYLGWEMTVAVAAAAAA